MASIKVVLRKDKKKKDGTCPLVIQIIKDRRTRRISLDHSIHEKDWDKKNKTVKKSHPNSIRLNNLIKKKISEADNKLLEIEISNQHYTAESLKEKIKSSSSGNDFFGLAANRISQKYVTGVFSVAGAEKSILYNIQEFLNVTRSTTKEDIKERRKKRVSDGRKETYNFLDDLKTLAKSTDLAFEQIDQNFLDQFQAFCSAYLEQSKRTIANQLIFIRTLYNEAIKKGHVEPKYYPFAGEGKKIRLTGGHKIGLTKEEVSRIERQEFEMGSQIWHTRNVWLFAYYFAGVRISDVLQLKWQDFKDGRLLYVMNKNDKPVSLKIPEQANNILVFYKKQNRGSAFVFPFLDKADLNNNRDVFVKSRNATSLLNSYLKKIAKRCMIEKNLSNHIARHTFGNVAGDKINPLMLQKLYRHSDLKTTINYQANFIHKDADEALEIVIS